MSSTAALEYNTNGELTIKNRQNESSGNTLKFNTCEADPNKLNRIINISQNNKSRLRIDDHGTGSITIEGNYRDLNETRNSYINLTTNTLSPINSDVKSSLYLHPNIVSLKTNTYKKHSTGWSEGLNNYIDLNYGYNSDSYIVIQNNDYRDESDNYSNKSISNIKLDKNSVKLSKYIPNSEATGSFIDLQNEEINMNSKTVNIENFNLKKDGKNVNGISVGEVASNNSGNDYTLPTTSYVQQSILNSALNANNQVDFTVDQRKINITTDSINFSALDNSDPKTALNNISISHDSKLNDDNTLNYSKLLIENPKDYTNNTGLANGANGSVIDLNNNDISLTQYIHSYQVDENTNRNLELSQIILNNSTEYDGMSNPKISKTNGKISLQTLSYQRKDPLTIYNKILDRSNLSNIELSNELHLSHSYQNLTDQSDTNQSQINFTNTGIEINCGTKEFQIVNDTFEIKSSHGTDSDKPSLNIQGNYTSESNKPTINLTGYPVKINQLNLGNNTINSIKTFGTSDNDSVPSLGFLNNLIPNNFYLRNLDNNSFCIVFKNGSDNDDTNCFGLKVTTTGSIESYNGYIDNNGNLTDTKPTSSTV